MSDTLPADALRVDLLHALDFAYCASAGYETPEQMLDAYDAARAGERPAPDDRAADYWRAKLHAVTEGRDGLKRENMRPKRDLAHAESTRENADFHLGQEMARRQLRADQATVLRDAADRLDRLGLGGIVTKVLRNMADEAETEGPR